jgi:hypothetical protein
MRWLLLITLVACGAKAKPQPPPAELEVTGPASIAGDWVTDDDMSSYALTIQPDGKLVGRIDRGKLPACDRVGVLTGDGRKLALAMTKNTCEQADPHPGNATFEVASFTGTALTIAVTIDGSLERRTYTRRPN